MPAKANNRTKSGETKQYKPSVGFWKRNGKNGEFFSSMPIDAATYDMLQRVKIGDQLFLNNNSFAAENPKQPALRLTSASSREQASTDSEI